MLIKSSFEVAQPVDKVWRFFDDIPQVAACLPGTDPAAVAPGILRADREPMLVRSDHVSNMNDSYWLTNPAIREKPASFTAMVTATPAASERRRLYIVSPLYGPLYPRTGALANGVCNRTRNVAIRDTRLWTGPSDGIGRRSGLKIRRPLKASRFESGEGHLKLLLVEDDPGVREGLVDLLEEIAPVQVATTVDGALAELEKQRFGLVFADLNIGAASGGGVLVARSAVAKQTPVVICTGASRREAESALGEVKADAILTKPFSIDDVLSVTQRLFRK